MASLIPGYEYDIFISYRQKDNLPSPGSYGRQAKYDGWVSEFVEALKTELESTFKEEVSVYFDINPHDGLLETHDVDASLKDKLKCLIFIPIISRTYCDPKSFAWEHEFKAFVEQASKDKFGLKVKLPNGNVANRVLPIRIHDLDNEDIKLCQSVLGAILRGIEFIYKEPGVNKPLIADDDENKNLNSTKYRIQINKTANTIKDIISGLKGEQLKYGIGLEKTVPAFEKPAIQEKSIIVLPFENISPDPDQDYFSDGLTEEIITDLSHVQDLLVISRSSAMTFKGTKKTIPEIAQTVKVRYALEGSVRKAGNNLRITAQLIDSITDAHLWAEKYTGVLDDVFDIQEKVSRSIVESLKVQLSPAEKKQISARPIEDVQAYEFYLKGIKEIQYSNENSLERAYKDFQAGLKIVGDNALIYAGIASVYCNYYELGIKATEEVLKKAEVYAFKVLELDPSSSLSYLLLGRIERFRGNALRAIRYFKQSLKIDPYNPEAQFWLVIDYLLKVGRPDLSKPILQTLIDRDPMSPTNLLASGIYNMISSDMNSSLQEFDKMASLDPESVLPNFWSIYTLIWNNEYEMAYELIDQIPPLETSDIVHKIFNGWLLFLKYALKGEKEKAFEFLTEEVLEFFWNDADFPWLGAGGYALIGEKDEALRWLEHCLNKGSINYPLFTKIDPFFYNIHGEERFKKLIERVKYEWENFKV